MGIPSLFGFNPVSNFMGFTVDPFTCELLASGFQGGSGASRRADRGRKSIRRLCKWPYLLGGSWAVISWVISPLIWVITLVILLITLLITTHEPPSMMRSAQLFVISFGACHKGFTVGVQVVQIHPILA